MHGETRQTYKSAWCNVLVLICILYALIFRLKVPKNSPSPLIHTELHVTNSEAVNGNGHSREHIFKLTLFQRHSSNRSRFRLSVRFNRAESMTGKQAEYIA
ncbi:hypothetical protein ACTXT7_001621 [Hymenolepis weldensis]